MNKYTTPNDLEDYIRNLSLELADLEILGSSFLIAGYFNLIIAANIDKIDVLSENNEEKSNEESTLRPTLLAFIGETIILEGLIILSIVAIKRVKQKQLESSGESLSPYEKLADAYILSVAANIARVEAFGEIDRTRKGDTNFL